MDTGSRASFSNVAIIGAGPAGLVTARYLKAYGFTPVLFEKGDRIGGQWSGNRAYSGVWPSLHTNTSRIMTRFSDLEYEAGTPHYPSHQEVLRYLHRYANRFELRPHIRLKTSVVNVKMTEGGYAVQYRDGKGDAHVEMFARVVVASGRHCKPFAPELEGLAEFTGRGGVQHIMRYNRAADYKGMRVLVAGCSFSALEVASELALQGAAVTTANRRQRYVFPKLVRGIPIEHIAFTRFAALAEETFLPEIMGAKMKSFALEMGADPVPYGGPAPAGSVFEAGTTLCQRYLPLIAEGRITPRPWIRAVDGQTVRFTDGSEGSFDAILLGTGYQLSLPFLSEDLHQRLRIDRKHIDLYMHTFHPDTPGLAFAGILELAGPYFPVLELQARWITYTWSGTVDELTRSEMEAGLSSCKSSRGTASYVPFNATAILFSRLAGVEPDPVVYPELARALYFGPLSPESFRLEGPDALPDAVQRVQAAAAAFGAISSSAFTSEQLGQLAALADVGGDDTLTEFVIDQLAPVRGVVPV